MKSSAYLNKEAYMAFRILAVIGIFLGGLVSFLMIVGIGMDLLEGNPFDKTFRDIFITYFGMMVLFHWVNYKVSRANMYTSLFENDPDGVLQLQVLAQAMGEDTVKIKKEVRAFIKFHILRNCRIEKEQTENIVLTRIDSNTGWAKQAVICKNCGAENHIRMGYVYSCSYCGSKLGSERVVSRNQNQRKTYFDKGKMILTGILSGLVLFFLGIGEITLFLIDLLLIASPFMDQYNEGDRSAAYALTMTFILFGLIWFGVFRLFSDAWKVGKLNRLFIKDEDGLVAMSDAAKHLHMKQSRFFFYFNKLIRKKKLLNCSVFSEDPTYILLDNGTWDIRKKYAVCQCRNCGAPSTLRIGFERNCKYCGAAILRS